MAQRVDVLDAVLDAHETICTDVDTTALAALLSFEGHDKVICVVSCMYQKEMWRLNLLESKSSGTLVGWRCERRRECTVWHARGGRTRLGLRRRD